MSSNIFDNSFESTWPTISICIDGICKIVECMPSNKMIWEQVSYYGPPRKIFPVFKP